MPKQVLYLVVGDSKNEPRTAPFLAGVFTEKDAALAYPPGYSVYELSGLKKVTRDAA